MKKVIKADSDSVVSVKNVSEDKFYVLEQIHAKDFAIIHKNSYFDFRHGAYEGWCFSDKFTAGNSYNFDGHQKTLRGFIEKALSWPKMFKVYEFETAREMLLFLAERV